MATLFDKAKQKGGVKQPAAKKQKDEILVVNAEDFSNVKRLAELNDAIAALEAEKAIVYGSVRALGIEQFNKKYENEKKYTESFKILVADKAGADAQTAGFMLAPTDKYIKIDADRAEFLKNKYGEEVVAEETTFKLDNDMLNLYGEVISKLIENCTEIPATDKEKLIKAETALAVKKGTIKAFRSNDDMRKHPVETLTIDFQPIFQIKNPKVEGAEAEA